MGRPVRRQADRSIPSRSGIRIGVAGRSAQRLGALRQELPEADWPLIVVDTGEQDALSGSRPEPE